MEIEDQTKKQKKLNNAKIIHLKKTGSLKN
jgi:hypothetical protein